MAALDFSMCIGENLITLQIDLAKVIGTIEGITRLTTAIHSYFFECNHRNLPECSLKK